MTKKMLKSTVTVSAMTLLSRILGFIRDMVVARIFGAGLGTDAFFVAFKIPNFMRRLFAEGAFAQSFVPVLSEYKTQREHDEIKRLTDDVAGTFGAVLLLITIIGVLAAPLLIAIFAPGFLDEPGKYDLATEMLRLTFPYIFFISLTAFAGGILNTYGRFGVPAFTPVLLNLVLISFALWLAPQMDEPIMALAWGVFFAGIAQLLFQFPFLAKLKLLPRPRFNRKSEGVQKIKTLMIPAIFGSSVAQINLLLDTLIASFLVTGSVTWLYFSDRLVEFPLGVFGIALATVILPSLSRQHAAASPEAFSRTLDWALRWVLIVGTPAMVGLFLLAGPMLTTLFQYGEFSQHDVEMATRSLMAYSIGLMGFILVKVLAPGFYARQDTKTPVKIGIIAMVANMVMNLILVFPLAHAGLALATSLSAFLNAFLLFRVLRRDGVYKPESGWLRLMLQVLLANLAMAALLWWGASDLQAWFAWGGWQRAMQLLLWIAAGAVVYFAVLLITGVKFRQLWQQKGA
ncbi:MAG TPA: murein biosynthesis integral membrane protein MurJ [Candidatus Tenderia electrophaga]|uniref:Probable lipid II flippase MurJ n=1 Tax=Candidatus Tenderia electrophaga TaxID=1748243 RepID=A0A832J7S5_9GAMM|nr:murein biosynthesis integral membrane protein MurJ [Candidatus Tenderia electrophaga]